VCVFALNRACLLVGLGGWFVVCYRCCLLACYVGCILLRGGIAVGGCG